MLPMRFQVNPILWIAFGILITAVLFGCQSIHYYRQAIRGQYQILSNRQPISEIVANPSTPAVLRDKLTFLLAVREFAKGQLQLPVNNHYLTYVDLKKPYVAWNVFAAPELSLVPKTWCYPIVGCAAYRGYFAETDASRYADSLRDEGYDVYVGGVTAYSTLGWFDDPVLSTFMRLSRSQVAALIFHELAHQILYVGDDTAFNESFATSVEQEGLRRWQRVSGDERIYTEYERDSRRERQFVRLIMKYRHKLEELYGSDRSAAEKKAAKAEIVEMLRAEYDRLKTNQTELSVYEVWMRQPLNNAQIGSVTAYYDFVPAFDRILADNHGNLDPFYRACRDLAKKKKPERDRILNLYMTGSSPDPNQ